MLGLVFQLSSQVAESSKNLLGEIVLTGAGLKLDVLTFVLFQAPFSLVPLMIGVVASWTPEVMHDFLGMWWVVLLNLGGLGGQVLSANPLSHGSWKDSCLIPMCV